MSQSSGWMDADVFKRWLQWWYDEVRKLSSGPWLLILDDCSGHDNLPAFDGVRYFFLPANTTAMYQPLDLGTIAATKIRYRSVLLRKTINILLRMRQPDHGFQNSTGNGIYGLQQGQMPHVADAMMLLDQEWNEVSAVSTINCWLKSTCLPEEHVQALKNIGFSNGDMRNMPVEDLDLADIYCILSENALLVQEPLPENFSMISYPV